jgi:hypothetical protein
VGTMKITKYALAMALGFLCLMLPGALRADTITFSVTGSFSNGATFAPGSTITIDNSTGLDVSTDLTLNPSGDTFLGIPDRTNSSNQYSITGSLGDYLLIGSDTLNYFVGFTGGILDKSELPQGIGTLAIFSRDTTLVPTPEPSSIYLLGTALLGLMTMTLWRKKMPA